MASGTISLGQSGNLLGQIVWSSTSNGSVANTSSVTAKIQVKKSSNTTEPTTGTWNGELTVGSKKEDISIKKSVGQSWITLHTITQTIKHSDDGKGTCYIYGKISGPSSTSLGGKTVSGSKTVTLDTIPRASVLGTISNFTLGNAINIPITKKSSSFTDSLTISLNGTTIKTISSIANGDDVSFTSAELTKIYGLIPSGSTGTFTFKLTTKSGSTQIGTSSKTATGTIPSSVKPTISSVTISEANTNVVPSDWEIYVKDKTKLKIVISAAAGSGSSVSSVKTTINGSTYTGSTITTNLINASGTLTATITVTDKRGRTTSTTKNISVVDYDVPYITNLSAIRCDKDGNKLENGTYAKVSLVAGVYSLNDKNTSTYSIKYKKTTEIEYQTHTFDVDDPSIDDYVILSGIETNSSYNIMGVVEDYFTEINENMNPPLMSVFRTMNFLNGGRGGAVGKMAEEEDVWEVAFQTKLTGGLKPIFLEADTDLNDVRIPNFYTGRNVSTYNYGNCPIDSGTFSLEVVSCGEEGQVKQKLVYCSKIEAIVWERFYYQTSWGEWIRTSDFASGKLLASPSMYMTEGHNVKLSENISKQQNGIVLVFSAITDGTVENSGFNSFFVHKSTIKSHSGSGHNFFLTGWGGAFLVGSKYLYINDDSIVGNKENSNVEVVNGISFNSNRFVLRYVIGV